MTHTGHPNAGYFVSLGPPCPPGNAGCRSSARQPPKGCAVRALLFAQPDVLNVEDDSVWFPLASIASTSHEYFVFGVKEARRYAKPRGGRRHRHV
jgi:hypothetical protein